MENALSARRIAPGRLKFIIGGLLIIAAIIYLIVTSTQANSQYFMTIDELQSKSSSLVGQDVRISGAVIGDTIKYDPQSMTLSFSVANVPGDNRTIDAQGGLAAVLHAAVLDPKRARLQVIYKGGRPDLLQNEAQAIMTGKLGPDGVFTASELLLKCPTRYQNALPKQASAS